MTKFKITSKEKFGDMPKGTTLTVETPLSSCDPDKIKAAIKAAGFNKQAQDAYSQAWWDIKKVYSEKSPSCFLKQDGDYLTWL